MPSRYEQWMYDWETRLTSVDDNRVVRPLDWGIEWAEQWPCRNGHAPEYVPEDAEKFLREFNQRIVMDSDRFFSYQKPADFVLERREVQVFSTRAVPGVANRCRNRHKIARFAPAGFCIWHRSARDSDI